MPFADELDAVQGVFDEAFGEAFTFEPMRRDLDPNKRGGDDPTRRSFAFSGVVSDVHARALAENGPSQYDVGHPGHTTGRISVNVYLPLFPYRPVQGDRVRRVGSGEVYKIAEVRPEGDGRAALDLNLLTRAP